MILHEMSASADGHVTIFMVLSLYLSSHQFESRYRQLGGVVTMPTFSEAHFSTETILSYYEVSEKYAGCRIVIHHHCHIAFAGTFVCR